ncbi:MAG: glycosyltransferase family protein [Solirubrobacterales bacterium]|nr:glycosyltransferase family protein [Solirubrobacterales bacterium]
MRRVPEVTVVIPTRNRAPLLCGALSSALVQEEVDVEVIVIDDGSTDDTQARLDRIGDPRLRRLRNPAPEGVARARNAGLALAAGEWVAFLDDDDLWAPRKLRRQLDAAAAAGASFAYGAAIVVDEGEGLREEVPAPPADTIARDILARNVIPGGCSNAIARAELVRAVGGFDEGLAMLAHWDLWIRLLQRCPAAACPEVVVAHRPHGAAVLDARSELETPACEQDGLVAADRGAHPIARTARWGALPASPRHG